MKRLTEIEFNSTFSNSMRQKKADGIPDVDFWSYFDNLPKEEFGEFDFSENRVEWIYTDSSGKFEHVLVNSKNKNIFFVMVLDLKDKVVYGHRVLNLENEYGINERKG